jgi:hypothetical protein
MGARHAGHVPGEFHHGQLHAQADAQIGNPVFAGEADRADLAFGAPLAEAAGHQDGVHAGQDAAAVVLEGFGIDVMDVDLAAGMDAGVGQGFGQGFVGLGQVHVLADEGDVHLVFRVLQGVDQPLPHRQVGRLGQQAQLVADDLVQHLVVQHGRDLVDGIRVQGLDHRFRHDVAEQGDLAPFLGRNMAVGPAQQHVRLDADLAQFLDRMLGRLGLQLAGGGM